MGLPRPQTSNNRSTGIEQRREPRRQPAHRMPNAVDVRPLLLDYDYRWKSGAAFVQNDWKVAPEPNLNLGLRYSLQYPRPEKNNLQGVFRPDLARTVTLTAAQRRTAATDLGVPAAVADPRLRADHGDDPAVCFLGRGGRSKYITPVDYLGFEPRFGFAWSPKMKIFGFDLEKRSAVIRGGYGISHAPLTGNNRNPNPDFGGFCRTPGKRATRLARSAARRTRASPSG